MALGLLGDLVGHDERELLARSGLALQRGRLGAWLVGEQGAFLVQAAAAARPTRLLLVRAGRDADGLPAGDRVAHLLLALREDEEGFATVANLAFLGRAVACAPAPRGTRPARAHRRPPSGRPRPPPDESLGMLSRLARGSARRLADLGRERARSPATRSVHLVEQRAAQLEARCAWASGRSRSTTRAPVGARTLRSSACAQTAPNRPVVAPITAAGLPWSGVSRADAMPSRSRS